MENTHEKEKIASFVKSAISIRPTDNVLDVGSSYGDLVRLIQPNTKNITMVDILDQEIKDANYIKQRFEECNLNQQYDLVIASHVWGHFAHSQTSRRALEKVIRHTKNGGKIIITHNTNTGFFGYLGEYVKSLMPQSEINQFDEKLTKPYLDEAILKPVLAGYFNSVLTTETFEELANMCRVFFVNDEKIYEKNRKAIHCFLSGNLYSPELMIEQKMTIFEKGEVK